MERLLCFIFSMICVFEIIAQSVDENLKLENIMVTR